MKIYPLVDEYPPHILNRIIELHSLLLQGPVQYISIANNAKSIITSDFREKNLQIWRCDLSSKSVSSGPVLPMRHTPLAFECKSTGEEKEDGLVVLAVSESGVCYVWNLNTISEDEVNPTKITVKGNNTETEKLKGESAKKSRTSIFAAKLHDLEDDKQLTAVIAYGSIDSPQFSIVNIINSGENIVVNAVGETETARENGILPRKGRSKFISLPFLEYAERSINKICLTAVLQCIYLFIFINNISVFLLLALLVNSFIFPLHIFLVFSFLSHQLSFRSLGVLLFIELLSSCDKRNSL